MKNKIFIICLLLTSSAFGILAPTPVHAQATGAACVLSGPAAALIAKGINKLFGAVGINVPVNEDALRAKAFSLDRLASCAAKELLHQMTVATINWINSGFNGSPAFLTNPEGFFLDAADQFTGSFLSDNGPLQNLCSPWSVDIRLALAFGQSSSGN